MSFLDKIRACNAWDPAGFLPFYLDGLRVGSLRPELASGLRPWPERFRIAPDRVDWTPSAADFDGRTRELDLTVAALVEQGHIERLHGERFPLTPGRRDQGLCLIDRAAAPYFGARAFGQHLNGWVRTCTGIDLWIGRRSANRRIAPGKLDNLVAGGLPHGAALRENLRKECREEADIGPQLADRAVPVGALTYCRDSRHGLKPDCMYCYDLELPNEFVPRCTDGEVDEFYRLPAAEVARLVRDTDAFKLNCTLVILDFLIRHGLVDQDDPDYLALLQGLHSPLP